MKNPMRFYEALPKRKAELVDGKLLIAGSLEKSAMALAFMVEQLGAAYVADLVSTDLLRDAVIEVYGKGKSAPKKLADYTPIESNAYLPQKLATDLRLGLWREEGFTIWGGGTAIKLGEDVFMPDVYLIKNEHYHRLKEYYFVGAPDLIMEVVVPYMRTFDFGTRLERYAAAGVPEVWMLDFEERRFEPLVLQQNKYEKAAVESEWYDAQTFKGLSVQHGKMFDSAKDMGVQMVDDVFKVNLPHPQPKTHAPEGEQTVIYGTVPFAPRLDLEPVPIKFEEFISWGGEVKFELVDGKPLFGGGDETTKEWLGLLIMTLGLKETVKYLSPEAWSAVL